MTIDITPEEVERIATHFDKRVAYFDNMTGACMRTVRDKETRDFHEATAIIIRALFAALERSQAETAAAQHGWDDQKARHHECWLASVKTLYRALDAETALQQSQAETAAVIEAAYIEGFEDGLIEYPDRQIRPHMASTVKASWETCDTRNSLPADSKAAIDRMISEAEERGMRKAVDIINRNQAPCSHVSGWSEKDEEIYECGQTDAADSFVFAILAAIPKGKGHE